MVVIYLKEGLNFSYAGIRSEDMGLLNVSLDSGMFEEIFVGEREIQEVVIRGRDEPYFQGIKTSPLVLSLSFAFEDTYDESKIREVSRWLNQSYYQPFFTTDNPNRIFYCILHSSSKLLHNGLKQGYVTIEMRCDSPYSYSPQYLSPIYNLSANIPEGTRIDFTNSGDVICKPEIWVTKIGNGDVSIVNETNAGHEFKFTGLLNNETVYVDNDKEVIKTDIAFTYRYSNFNDGFLDTVRGVNRLLVIGNCNIQFRYQFKTLQG
jgi:phage-related protein